MALRCSFVKIIQSRLNIPSNIIQPKRYGSYTSSPFLEDLGEVNTKYEVTSVPDEWKYVERALPPSTVPPPSTKEYYASGWKPQSSDVKKLPYFVERTKNHMVPVYLTVGQRGIRRHTVIRRIQGDINLLEKELVQFLQKDSFRQIRSQVNEFAGYIRINGDFVNASKYFLEQKKL